MGKIKEIVTFLTRDIWRVKKTEVGSRKYKGFYLLKVIYLSIQRYTTTRVQTWAKALTYSTVMSLVPILAMLFAIAKGFGFSNLMEKLLREGIAVGGDTMDTVMEFIDGYLEHAQSGAFIGIGLVVLLWAIISLTGNIEQSVNEIWGVKRQRSYFRKITDYFSMALLLPVFIICLAGISIFMTTLYQELSDLWLLSSFVIVCIKLAPYVLAGLTFTALFCFFPNTKVQLRHAIVPGMLTGFIFQAFFYFYIHIQVNVSSYNAIYGTFAIIPLLLFFIRWAWCIFLFGVQMCYVSQNLRLYSFNDDVENVSRRFHDFCCVLFGSLICRRFVEGGQPYTIDELSTATDIPVRLTAEVVAELERDGILYTVGGSDDKSDTLRYVPAHDLNQLTVGYLLSRIVTTGSEDFKVDYRGRFAAQWTALVESEKELFEAHAQTPLKDL